MAVRAGAVAAIGAAVAVPLLRRRARIPAPVTMAACAAGPLGLAVLHPRSRKRDVAMYALQMWAFTMVHELPYDDPERLRARLRIRYPIVVDRAIGLGRLPNVRLQRGLARLRRSGRAQPLPHLGALALVHRALRRRSLFILLRHPERFPAAARKLAAVFDLGCAVYFAAPTAPPWWASEQGHSGRRGAADHGGGGQGDLEIGLAGDVRGAGGQSLGGDALAALRHLGVRGDLACRDRAAPPVPPAGATP